MNKIKAGLAILFLAVLLDGCASAVEDADAGPNPGGGFYGGHNLNVGHVNPVDGGYSSNVYTSVGQAIP
jgi:PBP1b-binding outer membrane lipoprotein LpoB